MLRHLLICKPEGYTQKSMTVTLEQILADTRLRVETLLHSPGIQGLPEQARQHVPRGFKRALLERSAQGGAVIAELKKALPELYVEH